MLIFFDDSDVSHKLESQVSIIRKGPATYKVYLPPQLYYVPLSFYFQIPNGFLRKIEQMCSQFLWKGYHDTAYGAKVSWESCCTPKSTGGLSLKRFNNWNKVQGIKLIWLIFSASGSLWVSWIRRNLIGSKIFWLLDETRRGSWIWKSLCKLRGIAQNFFSV